MELQQEPQLVQNVIITSIVWVGVSVGYMRLRDEGIEDGMTLMGEEPEKDLFLMKMYPAIMVAMAVILIVVRVM